MLATTLEAQLFEVSSEDGDGYPVDGERRRRAYRAAQRVLRRKPALLTFDEAEVIFSDTGLFDAFSTAQKRKAWVNRMLEDNRVPCIWISNSVSGVAAAFVRRFDVVFELGVPPRAQRARMIKKA